LSPMSPQPLIGTSPSGLLYRIYTFLLLLLLLHILDSHPVKE
jgi:hypothetical protein